MKIVYQPLAFRGRALGIIKQANEIIESYAAQGYSLTLRQLYYQFVSRGLCPNTDRDYTRLGVIVSNARRAGLIDWEAIVDRTRFMRGWPHHFSPESALAGLAEDYAENLWLDQTQHVEVWFEKDALLGVFERACALHRLPMLSCRGYGSDSVCWEAAQRLARREQEGRRVTILHFGDHDPSGLDMSRDIQDRLALFGCRAEVKRLALTRAQVKRYNPPPNPAKESDSRYADYRREHGEHSWELDALDPDILVQLVRASVEKYIDTDAWDVALESEKLNKKRILFVSERFKRITKRFKP